MGCDCHIEETFRLLEQEVGWSSRACQERNRTEGERKIVVTAVW